MQVRLKLYQQKQEETQQYMENNSLTAVEGIRVGHMQNFDAATGCTVVLCPASTVAGIDQRGGAPGTHETALLSPLNRIEHVNAIVLTGGSAYGLSSVAGVMQYLEEQGIGHDVRIGVVPIIPAAVIFDLNLGSYNIRPDASMGRIAAERASNAMVVEGSIGAGTGASVGKLSGMATAVKSGVGSAAMTLPGGVVVAALMVVNAVGDVINEDGAILAGVRTKADHSSFADSLTVMQQRAAEAIVGTNTTIGVVATNATLTKAESTKMAQMAQNGLARTIRPVHTMFDGDTVFGLATCTAPSVEVSLLGTFAAEVTATAIRRAVLSSTSLGGLLSLSALQEVYSDH